MTFRRRLTDPSLSRASQGDLTDVEGTLKAAKGVLDGLAGAEAIVYSAYYRAASEYHKVGEFGRLRDPDMYNTRARRDHPPPPPGHLHQPLTRIHVSLVGGGPAGGLLQERAHVLGLHPRGEPPRRREVSAGRLRDAPDGSSRPPLIWRPDRDARPCARTYTQPKQVQPGGGHLAGGAYGGRGLQLRRGAGHAHPPGAPGDAPGLALPGPPGTGRRRPISLLAMAPPRIAALVPGRGKGRPGSLAESLRFPVSPGVVSTDPQQVFDAGDVDGFVALVDQHREAYFAQPALANRQEFVKVRSAFVCVYVCVWMPACDRIQSSPVWRID